MDCLTKVTSVRHERIRVTSEKGLENINEVQDCELNARFLPWAKVEGIHMDTSVRIGQSRGVFIKHESCQAECNILSFSMYVNAAHSSQSQPQPPIIVQRLT